MPLSTTYTIQNTQGTLSFNILVGAATGPKESVQTTDLTLYGYGRTGWGQEVDQNFYHLLENFACAELTAAPTATPKTKVQLGGTLGVNKAVKGQSWFNITTNEMYVCSNPTTNTWKHLISEEWADAHYGNLASLTASFLKLDGSNSPMTGYLVLHANPRTDHPMDAATKQYVDTGDTTTLTTASTLYVKKTGDRVSGGILVTGSNIDGYNTNNDYIPSLGPHIVLRTAANEGGSGAASADVVIGLGATNGTLTTPHLDFHSSGLGTDYDCRIISSGGSAQIGSGTLTLIGFAMVDRVPTLGMQITNKSWVEAAIAAAVAGITGGSSSLYVAKAGDTMTGFLTLHANPTAAMHAATKQYVDTAASGIGFTAGTRMPFAQASAPAGWVQDTSSNANNRMLRVVTSTGGGVGGSDSPILMDKVPTHTHTFTSGNESASHTHDYTIAQGSTGLGEGGNTSIHDVFAFRINKTRTTDANTTHHTHSGTSDANTGASNWSPKYIDMIICQKS